jgi:hypothetical protein
MMKAAPESGFSPARIALLSAAVLVPCFWQSRIQAGDLSSHIYNAWLAQQIELTRPSGLQIVPAYTNVVFDLILSGLFRAFGADIAQRIAVSLSVLIFFWGAFAFVCTATGRRPWYIVSSLLMLTYGWVFHVGFFNFYLGVGLCLWAVTLSLLPDRRAHAGAACLLAAAFACHAMAFTWAAGVIAYTWVARRLSGRRRFFLPALMICAVPALGFWVKARYPNMSSFHQVLEAVAVDQVWTFGLKYCGISIALTLLWGFLLLIVTNQKGMGGTGRDVLFHLCIFMAIGILTFPTRLDLPQYRRPLAFITERMTLPYGILICAFLSQAEPPKWLARSFAALAFIYFVFLYGDTQAMNRVETRMERLTAGLSTRDRVLCKLYDPYLRVPPWGHTVDRVCAGRCLSYGNYEPITQQFRIRATGPNPLVVWNPADYGAIEDGRYTVKPGDLPLYQIATCGDTGRDLCLKNLQPGDVTGNYELLLSLQ